MLLNCKFCGGDLDITEGEKITTCKYCRTTQTLPVIKEEQSSNLFNRANALRRRCDFDKAEAAFEKIIEAEGTEAEAYWGLVLSKYGIEYVDDKATGKMIPTCHRASYDSVIADEDYKSALKYADGERRALYEEQAKEIDRIQRDILALAQNEESYDVFICYKETDENGKRTRDSATANEIYYELTDAGFKVFYAAVTLDGKIGSEYEPIIFAALNSAKVMLVIGSKPEYFNAVWVKNEWSRFLKIMKKDRKKRLIPCYRDMDAYDLPEEFVHIQAQNMEKMAFLIDLIQGVKKVMASFENTPEVIVKEKETVLKETVVKEPIINQTTVITDNGSSVASAGGSNTTALLRRVFIFLEDGDFSSADEYCEKVLDLDPESAEAYLGKLMAELKVNARESLQNCEKSFDDHTIYKKIIRFGSETLKAELQGYIDAINTRNEKKLLENTYNRAVALMNTAKTEKELAEALRLLEALGEYKDAVSLAEKLRGSVVEFKRVEKYCDALFLQLKDVQRNGAEYEKKKGQLSLSLVALSTEINNLTALKNNWHILEKETVNANNELAEMKNKIERLNAERNSLGFFAGKRKKDLANEISNLEAEIASKTNRISEFAAQKQSYSSLENVSQALETLVAKETEEKNALSELSKLRSADDILTELNSYEYGRRLLNLHTIKFGKYTLSSKIVPEEIEWQILDTQNGKALVISKNGLDCQKFNETRTDVTWETCSLRQWLNNDFLNAAFTDEEKAMIQTVTVTTDKHPNPKYSTYPSRPTQDKLFLLSVAEAKELFSSRDDRKCEPSSVAITNGAQCVSPNGTGWWWLRSPGWGHTFAAFVDYQGNVSDAGNYVNRENCAVRPAMWIDINAI